MRNDTLINKSFHEHGELVKQVGAELSIMIYEVGLVLAKCLEEGGTIFWCGNGGSAADSQHLAAELVGRFKKDRRALRSIALTTDTSVLTCIANDYSYIMAPATTFGKNLLPRISFSMPTGTP